MIRTEASCQRITTIGGNMSNARMKAIVLLLLVFAAFPGFSFGEERSVTITVDVVLKAPANANSVRLWIPYPMSDGNQNISNVKINGTYNTESILREGAYGNNILYAEWRGPSQSRKLTFVFDVINKERITKDFRGKEFPLSRFELKEYLQTGLSPASDQKVRALAKSITKEEKVIAEKARAIYDWTADNMYRNPDVKGCGFGVVDQLLESKGGKCVDIHSVFVALARAADIPAREILGIRIPKGREGDMTKAQHCWAEFFMPGYGWVVVDPADVTKIALERKLSGQGLKPYKEYYFGAVDENRIAYGIGRDIVLNPPQEGEKLNYFMYPYAEVDGKPLNEDLYGFNIGYRISFKEKRPQ
jgi:transglutaminase-like putative cysteine protease